MKYGIFPLPQTAKIWAYSAFALSVFSVRITDLWTFYEVFPSNKLLCFLPTLSAAMKKIEIELRPEMIECAFNYFYSIECSTFKPFFIHNVICALSIEIIFKSFNSIIMNNYGEFDSSYAFTKPKTHKEHFDAHNLISLHTSLPEHIRNYLLSYDEVEIIKSHEITFTQARYSYEKNAAQIFDDSLMRLTARLLCKIVNIYRQNGCNHPFIEQFDINKVYCLYNQTIPLNSYLEMTE